MSRFGDALKLETMAEVNAVRRAVPKYAIPTIADENAAKDKIDLKQLEAWRSQVFALDRHTCRCCGVKVIRTLKRIPTRAEANHVVGRADLAVRYDVRNGITLCLKCHRRVTGMVADKLKIVGTVFFKIGKTRYINAREPVDFKKVA